MLSPTSRTGDGSNRSHATCAEVAESSTSDWFTLRGSLLRWFTCISAQDTRQRRRRHVHGDHVPKPLAPAKRQTHVI